jgi:hypothetical protein
MTLSFTLQTYGQYVHGRLISSGIWPLRAWYIDTSIFRKDVALLCNYSTWKWRQHITRKHLYLYTKLHDATFQKKALYLVIEFATSHIINVMVIQKVGSSCVGCNFEQQTLKMTTASSPESSVTIYQSSRRHISIDLELHKHRCENLKTWKVFSFCLIVVAITNVYSF